MIIAPPRQQVRTRIALGVFFALLLLAPLARVGWTDLRAAALLLRMENPEHPGVLAAIGTHPVDESLIEIPTSTGVIRARLYVPRHVANANGMIIVHGVHHLGIDEPRLIAFARSMSASGLRILTPELSGLADYRIDRSSIDLIGVSAREFSRSLNQKIGVLGLSFGGGLALLAASDPQYEPYIRFVVSVGAHDDLERVTRFLVSGQIVRPDGSILHMTPHEYGPLILIYSHVEDFFPQEDIAAARETLRLLLWENIAESRKHAQMLSPPSRNKMELLYGHDLQPLSSEMQTSLDRHRTEMAPVSPHGHLVGLHVPVLLLHGAADNVIPPSELLWLQQDLPAASQAASLISPALSHVVVEGDPSLLDKVRLIRFIAKMLDLANGV